MNHYLAVVISAAGKEARKEVPDRAVVKEAYMSREGAIKAGFDGSWAQMAKLTGHSTTIMSTPKKIMGGCLFTSKRCLLRR
jgi:hypothetical protein